MQSADRIHLSACCTSSKGLSLAHFLASWTVLLRRVVGIHNNSRRKPGVSHLSSRSSIGKWEMRPPACTCCNYLCPPRILHRSPPAPWKWHCQTLTLILNHFQGVGGISLLLLPCLCLHSSEFHAPERACVTHPQCDHFMNETT